MSSLENKHKKRERPVFLFVDPTKKKEELKCSNCYKEIMPVINGDDVIYVAKEKKFEDICLSIYDLENLAKTIRKRQDLLNRVEYNYQNNLGLTKESYDGVQAHSGKEQEKDLNDFFALCDYYVRTANEDNGEALSRMRDIDHILNPLPII